MMHNEVSVGAIRTPSKDSSADLFHCLTALLSPGQFSPSARRASNDVPSWIASFPWISAHEMPSLARDVCCPDSEHSCMLTRSSMQ